MENLITNPFSDYPFGPIIHNTGLSATIRIKKIPTLFYSFDKYEDTPFAELNFTDYQKAKYWSVVEHLQNTEFSISKIVCSQYLDTYYIKTPSGEEIYNGYYKKTGMYSFTPKKNGYANAAEIMCYLTDESNYKIKINYEPEEGDPQKAYETIKESCSENNILITNIFHEDGAIVYCLKTQVSYAYIQLKFNNSNMLTWISPFSTLASSDENINLIAAKLKELHPQNGECITL